MARMLILFCLLLPLLLESDSRMLLMVPDKLRNASATASHEESMEKEECKGVGRDSECSIGGKWMRAHTDYIYTQDLEP